MPERCGEELGEDLATFLVASTDLVVGLSSVRPVARPDESNCSSAAMRASSSATVHPSDLRGSAQGFVHAITAVCVYRRVLSALHELESFAPSPKSCAHASTT